MSQLNLYKIDAQKQEDFETALENKYLPIGDAQTVDRFVENEQLSFEMSFYLDDPEQENAVEWSWLLNHFGEEGVTSRSNPKGILVIKEGTDMFACTYGFSYFIVDKFCDTDFAFDFARRIRYKEVKTTTLLSPNLKRNKVVNTYLDYSKLEFDSGESFAKLKVKAELPEDFSIFGANLEAGHSIKFEIPENTVDCVLNVLIYVRNKIMNADIIYRIPVFKKVKDKEVIAVLDQRLRDNLKENPLAVNLSELDIIGVTEIFNKNDAMFAIKCGTKESETSELTAETILSFVEQNNLQLHEVLERLKIISFYNGISVRTDSLYNLIDYTDDVERCVLSKGKWYHFNEDYLGYLAASLDEIAVVYNQQYDFCSSKHDLFLEVRYQQEKNKLDYDGLAEDEIKKNLKKKYYRERAFNLIMSESFNFSCHDREEVRVGDSRVELMDLYKDETLYAVKIGNASSALCYALDQSSSSMKVFKHDLNQDLPAVRNVCVWLILDRRNPLPNIGGKPNINALDMLMLKNRIDAWKKEVRLLGYSPVIMINYFNL